MARNIIEMLMGRQPDKYITNEAGDTTGYQYGGTVPGGIPGLIGEMFGRGRQESSINEKPSDNPLNPLNQKVNEVSGMENANNYNQTGSSNNYMDKTKQYEGGAKDSVYIDSEGHPTYGVGHKLTPDELQSFGLQGQKFTPGQQFPDMKISESDISSMYESDYGKAQSGASRIFGENFEDAPKEIQGIMSDMVFNLGESGVANKFPSMKAMKSGDYAQAAAQMRYKNPRQDESGQWVAGDRGESNWWNQIGAGDERYASGEWDKAGSRGWDHYNTLMNMPQNTVNDVMHSNSRVEDAFNY
jgi:GH24 family phage-related lysozyme (muramidase)